MENAGNKIRQVYSSSGPAAIDSSTHDLHPAWQALIRFCRDVGHGEIERIKIQNGLPVSAEIIKKKIRWC